jgi:hypothetical protein
MIEDQLGYTKYTIMEARLNILIQKQEEIIADRAWAIQSYYNPDDWRCTEEMKLLEREYLELKDLKKELEIMFNVIRIKEIITIEGVEK